MTMTGEVRIHLSDAEGDHRKWHEVVLGGDRKRVAQLLEASPSLLNEVNSDGRTALHLAANRGFEEVVESLLTATTQQLSINVHDFMGSRTALHYAAINGHHRVVAQLLAAAGCLVNEIDHDGMTALHHAAALPVQKQNKDAGPQSAALHVEDNVAVVSQLLADPRTEVNAADRRGWTALHVAASRGNDNVVIHLLADRRASINARDVDGRTALQVALQGRHLNVIAVLLATNKDSIEIDEGGRILHLAIELGTEEELLAQLLAMSEASTWITVEKKYLNALYAAIRYDRVQVISQLLTLSPSLIDEEMDPLRFAVFCGSERALDMLVAFKPEWISSVNTQGDTLLHWALTSPFMSPKIFAKLWEFLSSSDAVRIANNNKQTPFAVAVERELAFAMELMQWKLSFDELYSFKQAARVRPLVEEECAGLLGLLGRDVMGLVNGYIFDWHIREQMIEALIEAL